MKPGICIDEIANKSFNLSRLLSRLCAYAQTAPMNASQVKLMLARRSAQDENDDTTTVKQNQNIGYM
jgi:hypothetical protein